MRRRHGGSQFAFGGRKCHVFPLEVLGVVVGSLGGHDEANVWVERPDSRGGDQDWKHFHKIHRSAIGSC